LSQIATTAKKDAIIRRKKYTIQDKKQKIRSRKTKEK